MATTQSSFARAYRAADEAAELNQYFAPQRTSTADLPDPETFLRNISRGVLEIFAGVREVDQLARWLTEDAYRKLVTRANLAARHRRGRGHRPRSGAHPCCGPAVGGHGRSVAHHLSRSALTTLRTARRLTAGTTTGSCRAAR